MNPSVRTCGLIAHILCSVGWFGAAVAYLPLSIFVLTYEDDQTVRGVYLALNVIGWFVLVPCSLAALVTGVVQSAISPWGLLRHYWVVAKLVLTVIGIAILMTHMPSVTESLNLSGPMQMNLGLYHKQLVVHAAGGVLLLSAITAISVIKPWGAFRARVPAAAAVALDSPAIFEQRRLSSHRIKRLALILIVAVIVLFIVLHLAGGHFLHH